MKSFDVARSAEGRNQGEEFQIGGEVFRVWLGAHPDDIAGFETIGEDTPLTEVLSRVDSAVLAMLSPENEGHDRYRALRARRQDPVTISDLIGLAQWLVEAQASRTPTGPSVVSSPPPGKASTSSTDDSSAPVTPGVQAA